MKRLLKYTLQMLFAALAFTACSDDETGIPPQPDFIVVGLEAPYTIQMGQLFELSVPEEGGADRYQWKLPEMLNIVEGANSARLMVTGLTACSIPAGIITVTAVNTSGNSAPRTLWKEITITGLPPRPAYVQSSIKGSLTVDRDEEFSVYVPDDDQIATYEWTVPAKMVIVSGGNTSRIVVKATEKSFNIPKDAVTVTTVSKTGVTETFHFEKMICVLPTDGYPAKRYGSKTWMMVNLNYAGKDGSVGRTATGDPDGSKYGRYYTWEETMTGLSAGTNPYVYNAAGTDDAGNDYTLNNSSASYNIQIQGICPEGWHVPNAYDFFDLVEGIADDYGVRKNSMAEIFAAASGLFLPNNRETAPMTTMNLTTYGPVASYTRGSGPKAAGGLWENHTALSSNYMSFTYAGVTYPMYMPERDAIGFNILPGGQYNTSGTFANESKYSYHWTATVDASNKHYRFTNGSNNCNFSTGVETGTGNNVRCVANY